MKKEKIYNYFYIINNLINGRFYLGVHSTNKLADGYMGSGDAIKAAIKNYGKENFELTPLKFFKTRKELMAFEKEIVNDAFLQYYRGICYNLKKGGEGGCEKVFTDEELKERNLESNRKSAHKLYQQNKDEILERNRVWREQNPEKVKELHRKYIQTPEGKESNHKAHRKYDRSPKGKEAHARSRAKKKAEKLAAQQDVII